MNSKQSKKKVEEVWSFYAILFSRLCILLNTWKIGDFSMSCFRSWGMIICLVVCWVFRSRGRNICLSILTCLGPKGGSFALLFRSVEASFVWFIYWLFTSPENHLLENFGSLKRMNFRRDSRNMTNKEYTNK